VQVERQARHAVDAEGPWQLARIRVAQVGQHPPADARVDVTAHAGGRGGCRDRLDRVDDAVGVGGCRGDDEHGPVVDRVRHRRRVGALGHGVDVDEHRLDPEPVGRLVEGGMRGRRQDHPRHGDVGAGIAGREHREQDRLGAT
jgi:hypothetical protein